MRSGSKIIKRVIDISVALTALVLLSPVMLYIAFRVKLSSPGPAIFRQQRVGRYGKPFTLLKFRSMYEDSEKEGPRLSAKNDPRVTSWGRTMRKWKLDELPQLWNILRGEMSLVGPRPEREFYIRQIPEFSRLLVVKPGLTSLGMVQFGYAKNIQEIEQRMQYDLQYLTRQSLVTDFAILIKTIRLVLRAKGH